ncbi:hypothetical protein ACFLIM_19510 [Nonomuraea sp. M3C6]|uniref:Uncharacterized protein n=1 Tax=Nonomuraea marmarensis TaxID=3351344 RepID=A0ABW7AGF0_9ACTN
MPSVRFRVALAALATAVSLTACGATSEDTGSTAAPASSGASQAGKVSANTASESEITAALEAAGVDNAARWTREVMEYRPYAADDPNLTSLRDNLAKYNPGQQTVDKIVSALVP